MLRCPFNTSSWEVSIPFRSLHLPKSWQGWNCDAVSAQEKISAAQGAKEGKINPTFPPLASCVSAPPAALVHCVSGWKQMGLTTSLTLLERPAGRNSSPVPGRKGYFIISCSPSQNVHFHFDYMGKKRKYLSFEHNQKNSHIYLLLMSKKTLPV